MSTSAISLDIQDGLAHLRFTDPARGNPMDRRLCSEISLIAAELSSRNDIRAILLTAEGKSFSFGGDIATFFGNIDDLPAEIKRLTTNLHSAVSRLQRMDAPIVAAVHGVCAGGMTGFVAGSDIIVAADNTRFVAAYTGIGFSCDAGTSVTLARRLGVAGARRFLLMNQTLDAQQALAAGLADEVVPAAELNERALAIARQLAAGPTQAYGEIRRLLLSVQDTPLETQLELEAQALARVAAGADAREGLTAFTEKRKPKFVGR